MRFSLRTATRITVLDRFMRDRILAKRIDGAKVTVRPPWSFDGTVRFDPEGRRKFRAQHGLEGKFVVMYAGNHSPCHPLETLLRAAERLTDDPSIVFCFMGGGSEWHKLRQKLEPQCPIRLAGTAAGRRPSTLSSPPSTNLLCLPYQPLDELAGSLSAADLHVVVMGDAFVGLVHPCKVYNILSVGAPVLSIGPRLSHLSEIARARQDDVTFLTAAHGEVDAAVNHILRVRDLNGQISRRPSALVRSRFSREAVLPAFLDELENCGPD